MSDWMRRFRTFVDRLTPGQNEDLADGWAEILRCLYSEPHRAYHGTRHVVNLLDRLDALRPYSAGEKFRPGFDRFHEAEAAIWFHDVIYVVGDARNEERSANLCRSFLVTAQALDLDTGNFGPNVYEAIMATKHDGAALSHNAARLMVDLDLAGFADPWDVFQENNERIRVEYAAVPPEAYRWGRIAFLAKLLARPIFNVLPELEAAARANIKRHARELAEEYDER